MNTNSHFEDTPSVAYKPRCPISPGGILDDARHCGREPGHDGPHRLPSGYEWDGAGAYERHESPDYCDGGVTAAKIEEEAHHEKHDAATLNTVANAVADGLVGPGEWMPLSVRYRVAAKVLDALREKQDAPVRECPAPEHPLRRDPYAEQAARFWHDRWREAAAQRDARDLAAHLWKEAARQLSKRVHGLGWERDQHQAGEEAADARAQKAEQTIEGLREEMAACDVHNGVMEVTDEMVERARKRGSELVGALWDREVVEAMIGAALTVPTRPEGAEDIEVLIEESLPGDALSDAQVQALANHLASRGVRVDGSGR